MERNKAGTKEKTRSPDGLNYSSGLPSSRDALIRMGSRAQLPNVNGERVTKRAENSAVRLGYLMLGKYRFC